MRVFLFLLAAVACPWFWMFIIAPLIGRAVGVPCRLALRRIDKQNHHLSARQYFWYVGVLSFGIGMFLFLLVQFPTNEGAHLSIRGVLIRLAGALILGAIAGLLNPPKEHPL
jgi:hypothetical protein